MILQPSVLKIYSQRYSCRNSFTSTTSPSFPKSCFRFIKSAGEIGISCGNGRTSIKPAAVMAYNTAAPCVCWSIVFNTPFVDEDFAAKVFASESRSCAKKKPRKKDAMIHPIFPKSISESPVAAWARLSMLRTEKKQAQIHVFWEWRVVVVESLHPKGSLTHGLKKALAQSVRKRAKKTHEAHQPRFGPAMASKFPSTKRSDDQKWSW